MLFFKTWITFHKLDLSLPHTKSLSSYQKTCKSNSQQNRIYSAAFTQMLYNSNVKKRFLIWLYHITSTILTQTPLSIEYVTNSHPDGCITAYKYQL
jgi:hypothetical protein